MRSTTASRLLFSSSISRRRYLNHHHHKLFFATPTTTTTTTCCRLRFFCAASSSAAGDVNGSSSASSTGSGGGTASGDLGLTRGRRRFYLNVDVSACDPPTSSSSDEGDEDTEMLFPRIPSSSWKSADSKDNSSQPNNNNNHTNTNWYTVTLDGRVLKTPKGCDLKVPSQLLAYAIAVEWNCQASEIKPTQMPLTTLACTAIDLAPQRDLHKQYQTNCLNFLKNDSLAYWADQVVERPLYKRQQKAWKPIVDAFENEWGYPIAIVQHDIGSSSMIQTKNSITSNTNSLRLQHPIELISACEKWISKLDAWHLTAFYSLCAEAKSFIVAWALLTSSAGAGAKADLLQPLQLSPQQASMACRVEEEFQISNWGMVEGGHDYDRLNCTIQLHSATVFTQFIRYDNE